MLWHVGLVTRFWGYVEECRQLQLPVGGTQVSSSHWALTFIAGMEVQSGVAVVLNLGGPEATAHLKLP